MNPDKPVTPDDFEALGAAIVRGMVLPAPCRCPVNVVGDTVCHVCGETVNVRCRACRTLRGAGPCPTTEPEAPPSYGTPPAPGSHLWVGDQEFVVGPRSASLIPVKPPEPERGHLLRRTAARLLKATRARR